MTTTVDHTSRYAAGHGRERLAAEPALRLSITLEVVLYAVIALAALGLHLAQLGAAPLNDAEAAQALAALRRVDSAVPGEPPVAASPFSFALQVISFTFGGATATAARLPVALGAVLLVLAPALWRRYLNPLPPLIMSGLLLVSPVVILAGRTSSPVIWSALAAVILPWCVLRAAETGGERRWALAATGIAAALALLAEPAGWLMLAGLGFGLFFAWVTHDDPEIDLSGALRRLIGRWPWEDGALLAGLIVVALASGWFLFPSGLTAVGAVLWDGLRGFVTAPESQPLALPLAVSLRYESGLLLFGLVAIAGAIREGGPFERVLAGWLLAGVFWSVVYTGASSAHALWLTLPLAALVGLQVTGWIVERAQGYWRAPDWAPYVLMLAVAALWLVLGVSLVLLGKRLLLELPAEATRLSEFMGTMTRGLYDSRPTSSSAVELQGGYVLASTLGAIQFRAVVSVLVLMLIGVLYFMAASLWGMRVAWRGFALGTLSVLLLTSLGLGARAALSQYDDPRELWFRDPVTRSVNQIGVTLRDYSLRSTGTPHLIEVTAQVPPDGALGWALRRFANTQFVTSVGPEVSSAAVLVPPREPEPVFGAEYVGKDLVTRQEWLRRGPGGQSSPLWRYGLMWLYRSASLDQPVTGEQLMIYLRADVYGIERVE